MVQVAFRRVNDEYPPIGPVMHMLLQVLFAIRKRVVFCHLSDVSDSGYHRAGVEILFRIDAQPFTGSRFNSGLLCIWPSGKRLTRSLLRPTTDGGAINAVFET